MRFGEPILRETTRLQTMAKKLVMFGYAHGLLSEATVVRIFARYHWMRDA